MAQKLFSTFHDRNFKTEDESSSKRSEEVLVSDLKAKLTLNVDIIVESLNRTV